MNRADERALAWALADAAAASLPVEARVQLNIKLGAGELTSAITDLLTFYAGSETPISLELIGALDVWIGGYQGTDVEPVLRRSFDRIPLRRSSNESMPSVLRRPSDPPAGSPTNSIALPKDDDNAFQ